MIRLAFDDLSLSFSHLLFLLFFLSLFYSFFLSCFAVKKKKEKEKRKNKIRRKSFQRLIHLQILMFSSVFWLSPLILCPSVIQTVFFCYRRTFGLSNHRGIERRFVGLSVRQFVGPSDHQAEGLITRLLIQRAIRHRFVSLLQETIGTLWSPSGSA